MYILWGKYSTQRTNPRLIIDKVIIDTDLLDSLIALGQHYNAQVYEFILFADRTTVSCRTHARGFRPETLLTPEHVVYLWNKMDTLRKQRPTTILVDTTKISDDQVYASVESLIS